MRISCWILIFSSECSAGDSLIIYNYTKSFNPFAAKFSAEEAEEILSKLQPIQLFQLIAKTLGLYIYFIFLARNTIITMQSSHNKEKAITNEHNWYSNYLMSWFNLRVFILFYVWIVQSELDQVLSVFPNRYRELPMIMSWDFKWFPQAVKWSLKMENDVVVGLLDPGQLILDIYIYLTCTNTKIILMI